MNFEIQDLEPIGTERDNVPLYTAAFWTCRPFEDMPSVPTWLAVLVGAVIFCAPLVIAWVFR
jgi:hypothetical protein